jgi:hypothetical protein
MSRDAIEDDFFDPFPLKKGSVHTTTNNKSMTNVAVNHALLLGIEAWKKRAEDAEKKLDGAKKRKSTSEPKAKKKKAANGVAKKPKEKKKQQQLTKEQLAAKVKRLESKLKKKK